MATSYAVQKAWVGDLSPIAQQEVDRSGRQRCKGPDTAAEHGIYTIIYTEFQIAQTSQGGKED